MASEVVADRRDEVGVAEREARGEAVIAGDQSPLKARVVLADHHRRAGLAADDERRDTRRIDVRMDDVGAPALAAEPAQGGEHPGQLRRHRRRSKRRAPVADAQRPQAVLDRVAQFERREPGVPNGVGGEHDDVVRAGERAGVLTAEGPEHRPVGPGVPLGDHEHAHSA